MVLIVGNWFRFNKTPHDTPQVRHNYSNGHANRQEKDTIRVIPADEFTDGIAAAASSMQGWR